MLINGVNVLDPAVTTEERKAALRASMEDPEGSQARNEETRKRHQSLPPPQQSSSAPPKKTQP
jgi:hypothetical protein